jgi:hypothetical protein
MATRIIVVLGMHRSGTSAVARGLKALGVDLGTSLIGGLPNNNEKGFWEDKEINAFNEELLKELDSSWNRLANFNEQRLGVDRLSSLRSAALALLGSKLEPGRVFGLKDPRMCVLLPFWQDIFARANVSPSYVLVVRSPVAIAASLERRDGFPAIKGMLLWAKYSFAAIRGTNGLPRVFLDYDTLMDSPERQMKRVARRLDLPEFADADAHLREYVEEFLSSDQRHHLSPDSKLADPKQFPMFLHELHQFMKALALDEFDLDGAEYRDRWELVEKDYLASAALLAHLDQWDRPVRAVAVSSTLRIPTAIRSPEFDASAAGYHALAAFEDRTARATDVLKKEIVQWNLDSLEPGTTVRIETHKELPVVRGWVLGRRGRPIYVAIRQSGVSRCYPLNEERRDVVEALGLPTGAESRPIRLGFRFTLNSMEAFDFGFEIGGVLAWFYHIVPA